MAGLQVTVVPRERWPLGQTVVRSNEARVLSNLYTRRYLEQQLLTVLAGAQSVATVAPALSDSDFAPKSPAPQAGL